MTQLELLAGVKKAIPSGSVGRYDLLPVFADPALWAGLAGYFASVYRGKVDCVAAPEAIGWILGASVARELGVGFFPLRKGGRLPYSETAVASGAYLDYTKRMKTLELKKGLIPPGSRVLLVDEWIETGATVECAMEMLEQEGCTVTGLAAIGIDTNENTREWIDSGFVSFIGKDI